MNYFSIFSVIFALAGLFFIGLSVLVNEGFGFAVVLCAASAAYLDHLGIEKEFRDFHGK